MGLDPGIRTGVKVAVVDATGKLLATDTRLSVPAQERRAGRAGGPGRADPAARGRADRHRQRHGQPRDRAAGRGCCSRCCRGRRSRPRWSSPRPGASVYSASELAAKEFPDLDVSLRGAVSIARRLQDPLAELVKIEPQVDRRRPVPARRRPAPAGPVARGGGRGRGQRGRRRSQHRLRAAARPRVGTRAVAGRGDRRASRRRTAPSAAARNCSKVARARAAGLRAGGRVPADSRRRRAARRLGASIRRPMAWRGGSCGLRPGPAQPDGRRAPR